jgi:hypothetical protein
MGGREGVMRIEEGGKEVWGTKRRRNGDRELKAMYLKSFGYTTLLDGLSCLLVLRL